MSINKFLIAAFCLIFSGTSLLAKDAYIDITIGAHGDLGGLGGTILKDGLKSGVGRPTDTNNLYDGRYNEGSLDRMYIVVPENDLVSREKVTGGILFKTEKKGGPMHGLSLGAFYESNVNKSIWYRAGLEYTFKVMGGDTQSSFIGLTWYNVKWDFRTFYAPFMVGYKMSSGERANAYIGAGVFLYHGGWELSGSNMGDVPTYLLANVGLGFPAGISAVNNNSGSGGIDGGSIVGESMKFNVQGIGITIVIGFEYALTNKNKVFFEIDRKAAAKVGHTQAKSITTFKSLSPVPSYPIDVGGTIFKFGYKFRL